MIDLHSHILHGLDDGARTLDESLEIARAAVADGIEVIAATPHVRDDWPTEAETMESRVAELRAALVRAAIPLDVRPGGEIAITWVARVPVEQLRRFTLGGGRHLLVETPYFGWPVALPDLLLSLLREGLTPVLAHPERNAEVQARPEERLAALVAAGVLVQVTAASVDGRIGKRAQDCGRLLIRNGLAHLLASDAHHASVRAVGLAAAAESVGGGSLGRWLTHDVPAAILADAAIPACPVDLKPTGWVARLLRT
jgi:protein-tyrosine phosphatase